MLYILGGAVAGFVLVAILLVVLVATNAAETSPRRRLGLDE